MATTDNPQPPDDAAAPPERPASFRDAPENVSIVTVNSDTFKGTPAEGVTTISTGPAGGSGSTPDRRPVAVTVADQNRIAQGSTTPPAPRTPETSAAALGAAGTAPAPTAAPTTGSAFAASPATAAAPAAGGTRGTGV